MDFKLKNYIVNLLDFFSIHKEMKKVRKYTREDIDAYSFNKIKELCIYVNKHVPYYRELLKNEGIKPDTFTCIEDFKKIPILDKDTIRDRYNELISDEKDSIKGVVENATSGSTGTPLRFLCDGRQNMAVFNLFWQVWSVGKAWHIGQKQALIGGYFGGLYRFNPINRILYMSSSNLNKDTVVEYYTALKKYSPKLLRGYPSSLYLFVKLLEEKGLTLHFDVVITQSETLLPFQRENIENYFGAKVIDQYSQHESVACICECECGKKHVYSNFGYCEVVDEDGKEVPLGTEGRLICTGYYNHVMPLIRYDTRDIVSFDEKQVCECGLNFPVVKELFGRADDLIRTPEGNMTSRISNAFAYSKGIKCASIYQNDINRIIVRLAMVSDEKLPDDDPLIPELRKRLGDTIDIQVQYLDEKDMPRTKGGKVRFIVSDL